MVYISLSIVTLAFTVFGVCLGTYLRLTTLIISLPNGRNCLFVIASHYLFFPLGIPLKIDAHCNAETGTFTTITSTITTGGATSTTTIITTVTPASSLEPHVLPSDNSKAILCQGTLKRHESLVLWNGMPNRTDTAGNSFTSWPWLEEVAAVTNALLELVKMDEGSSTSTEQDILPDEYVGKLYLRNRIRRLKGFSVH
jgi:hypothetical protein